MEINLNTIFNVILTIICIGHAWKAFGCKDINEQINYWGVALAALIVMSI